MITFDLAKLNKGDTLSVSQCEAILGVEHTSREYGLKHVALCAQVERELAAEGVRCKAVMVDGALHVLADEETPGYALREFEASRRKIGRAHMLNQEADRSNMTDAARQKHDRAIQVGAAYQQALARANTEVRRKNR